MRLALITFLMLLATLSCRDAIPDETPGSDTDISNIQVGYFSDLKGYPGSNLPMVPDSLLEDAAYPLKYLNIHCTATDGGVTVDQIMAFWKDVRKWRKPGYNLLVDTAGAISTLVPYDFDGSVTWDEVSYGVKGVNRFSINIAYIGGIDAKGKPKDTRTKAQVLLLAKIVASIRCRHPSIRVMGHRDHPNVRKACPSFNVKMEYNIGYQDPELDPVALDWFPVVNPDAPTDTVYWKGYPVDINY